MTADVPMKMLLRAAVVLNLSLSHVRLEDDEADVLGVEITPTKRINGLVFEETSLQINFS